MRAQPSLPATLIWLIMSAVHLIDPITWSVSEVLYLASSAQLLCRKVTKLVGKFDTSERIPWYYHIILIRVNYITDLEVKKNNYMIQFLTFFYREANR